MRLLTAALLGLLALSAACSTTTEITPRDIVSTIPWDEPESSTYRILDDDDEVGTAEFTIEDGPELGLLLFTQHFDFPERGFVNDARVIASAGELRPTFANYVIEGPDGELRCEAAYEDTEVSVHRVGEDTDRTDTLDIPDIAYDSWSDLFLWRTIAFAEDFETDYADILSCTLDNTQKQQVELKVVEQERVTVPAGEFDTWHLEIGSGGKTQNAWYATDDSRLLIKYDNGEQVFELTEPPE